MNGQPLQRQCPTVADCPLLGPCSVYMYQSAYFLSTVTMISFILVMDQVQTQSSISSKEETNRQKTREEQGHNWPCLPACGQIWFFFNTSYCQYLSWPWSLTIKPHPNQHVYLIRMWHFLLTGMFSSLAEDTGGQRRQTLNEREAFDARNILKVVANLVCVSVVHYF